MTRDRRPTIYRVESDRIDSPAIHICRFPVPEPRRFDSVFAAVDQDPAQSGALARQLLALPQRLWAPSFESPHISSPTGNVLWTQMDRPPLLLPLPAAREMETTESWSIRAMLTPSCLDLPLPADALHRAAWKVLAAVPPTELLRNLALLALAAEFRVADREWHMSIADTMSLAGTLRSRMTAEASAGAPLLSPAVVRWILREIAAATEATLEAHRREEFAEADPAWIVERAFFSRCSATDSPNTSDFMRAVWFLHDAFVGPEDTGDARALIAAHGFGQRACGSWVHTLDRWLRIWQVPRDHPVVAGRADPQVMIDEFREEIGIDPVGLLGGTWILGMRWLLWLTGAVAAPPLHEEAIRRFTVSESTYELSDDYFSAFHEHLAAKLEDFSTDARKEGQTTHALGSLPQGDSLACRNNPVLRFPDGSLIPMSLDLLADRVASLYRLKVTRRSRRRGSADLGYLFEAYVSDLARTLEHRHVVAHEAEISPDDGAGKVCDVVIAYPGDGSYLFVEASMQTTPRPVAAADPARTMKLAERYQQEADQAFATMERSHAIAATIHGPTPRFSTALVVAEQPILHTPALAQLLRPLRGNRHHRVVCGADEYEALIGLGHAGWSVPSIIAGWQTGRPECTLVQHLARLAEIRPPADRRSDVAIEEWLKHLPVAQSDRDAA